jgi:hypothetical protein
MNPLALTLIVVNAVALLVLPRRWAPLPLLVGTCYMTLGQGIDIGPLSFTALRILVAAGGLRILLRGERLNGGLNGLDWLMVVWSVWAIASSPFHQEEGALTFRFGLVYNAAGIYFLLRVFCTSLDDLKLLCRMTALVLLPVAAEMLIFEHGAFRNLFAVFGGVSEIPAIREGRVRASGPFAHPILAGTVGAVCLPLMVAIWRTHKRTALVGLAACASIVVTSASSGPLMSAIFAVGALLMWRFRARMRAIRWSALIAYVLLDLVMKAPAYYLISRIDVAGGSTGYHRARLIESSLEHLGEWWIVGTDYTRHWMPTGVSWSPNHTDITNHYLYMGVLGGLPLMFLLIAVFAQAFAFVGQRIPAGPDESTSFMAWTLGASLFAHAATSLSVSYFDQSFLFLYLTLAAISSTWSAQPVPGRVHVRPVVEKLSSRDTRPPWYGHVLPGEHVRPVRAHLPNVGRDGGSHQKFGRAHKTQTRSPLSSRGMRRH